MPWHIRRLDRYINPSCPRPYLAEISRLVWWTEMPRHAMRFESKGSAEEVAARTWYRWRDIVRVVRAEEA